MPIQERFLLSVDLESVPLMRSRALVIGSGVAGLAAAISAARHGPVILAAKGILDDSNSNQAQGGIAAALGEDDQPELHAADTMEAGGGLCDPEAVRILVEEGRLRCQELIDLGTPFDRENGEIAFTREGAHSRRRILHANGDATGRAIVATMLTRVSHLPGVLCLENHFAIDILHRDGVCYGALFLDTKYGRLLRVEAAFTVVASGGLGQVFRETTNPAVATGDGYAICYRAGAVLQDMEFVQFHPTTLYRAGAPRFLISEAVRGEGAYLLNQMGERFMTRYAEAAELSPRDVVSQSIFKELNRTGDTFVSLDLRHLDPALIAERFPNIMAFCADYGIDIVQDLVPVRPAVHYMMGGVKTDLDAATSVKNLYAAGEVASTGVHGANRLASNSLLEALVFGHRAGAAAAEDIHPFPDPLLTRRLPAKGTRLDVEDLSRSLKAITWRNIGVYRNGIHLLETVETIRAWSTFALSEQFQMRPGFEVQNMLTTAMLIAVSAMRRTESRGAHQRSDYPESNPEWLSHNQVQIDRLDGEMSISGRLAWKP
ncbi:MAG: L-aspartate oxidase [Planctomycetota bacterium]|jgi:L-aspartate oxidase|nr:L-aspartate oxidase [Planctomycetota bacterium]